MKTFFLILIIAIIALLTGTWIFDGASFIFEMISKFFDLLAKAFNLFGWNNGIL